MTSPQMKQLAERLIHATWDTFPRQVRDVAKWVLLDTLGAMLLGNQNKEIKTYLSMISTSSPGPFRVIGTSFTLNLFETAFVHGCGSVAAELDEGNQWSKGHPAAHVIPALVTIAQIMPHLSGKTFLRAIVTGYEACSRFGRATTLRSEAHAHGTWGALGAAASTLLLTGASKEEWLNGVELAASFALPTSWNSALEGALVRNAYTGHAAEVGVKVPFLVRSGFTAPKGTATYVLGQVLGTEFDHEALVGCDNEGWDIENNYFKPYAFCRYVHAPIDAFRTLLQQYDLRSEDIETVVVKTYQRAATLDNPRPTSALAAKFSIPYALAVLAVAGKADHRVFAQELLENEQIRALAERITVVHEPALDRDYPSIMPAEIEVKTRDGQFLKNRCDIARGGPSNPLTELDIVNKFYDITKEILSPRQQDQVCDLVLNFETASYVAQLFEILDAGEE